VPALIREQTTRIVLTKEEIINASQGSKKLPIIR
jgi:hypothetical protein